MYFKHNMEEGRINKDVIQLPSRDECLSLMEAHGMLSHIREPSFRVTEAAVLAEMGYPEVARIVKEHVYLAADPASPQPPGETEVVNYADKRVLHTRVVTLRERFADLLERYGGTPEAKARLAALEIKVQTLEDKIFAPLDLSPLDLLQLHQR